MISQCRKTGRNNNIILLNIEPSFTIHLCQWNVLCCRWENLAHIFSMTWRQEKAGAGTGDQRVVWRHLQQRRQPQHRLRGLLHCQAGQGRGQGGGGAAGRDALLAVGQVLQHGARRLAAAPRQGASQFRAGECQYTYDTKYLGVSNNSVAVWW